MKWKKVETEEGERNMSKKSFSFAEWFVGKNGHRLSNYLFLIIVLSTYVGLVVLQTLDSQATWWGWFALLFSFDILILLLVNKLIEQEKKYVQGMKGE